MASRRTSTGPFNPSFRPSSSSSETQIAAGSRVEAQGKVGVVRFVGTTEFSPGQWVGIELATPEGKNDGFVQGKRYFHCNPNHGIFVRPSQVRLLTSRPGSTELSTPHGAGQTAQSTPIRVIRAGGEHGMPPPSGQRLPPPSAVAGASDRRRTTMGTRVGGGGTGGMSSLSMRRLSGAEPSSTFPRPGSHSGMKSPTPGPRYMRGGAISPLVATSRPESREALLRSTQMTPTPTPKQDDGESASAADTDEGPHPRPETPASKTSSAAEPARTPYRPALTTDESSVYEAVKGTSTISEQTVPLKEYEELRLKYKFLEQKRSEDRQRIQEAERIRAEAEQALKVREKLVARITTLQDELRKTKQSLKEKEEENNELENKYQDTVETLEMLSVDKEMVEEKSEDMAQEIARLKEQLAEATTSLDVYKSEGDLGAVTAGGPDGLSTMDVLQVQRQNERLKEALVKLRDVTNENEAQLNERIKELAREVATVPGLQEQVAKYKAQQIEHENLIEDLKQRLDDALGTEDMIEELSERNLNLSEKIEQLSATIEELEALREVNDEMEENHIETEKQLQAEIEYKDTVIRHHSQKIEKLEETVADYQNTISQFRELVANLQADIQKLRDKEREHASEAENLSSQSQAMMSLNMQLQATVLKAKAKTLDLELRKLEALQAAKQLSILEAYTPATFFKSESEALKTLLLFERLAFKAQLICGQLEQDEEVEAAISDDFVNTAEARYLLALLQGLAQRFVVYLSVCDDTEFMKLGFLHHDVSSIEKRLEGFIEQLRREEFKPVECVHAVKAGVSQLRNLVASYAPAQNTYTLDVTTRFVIDSHAYGSDVILSNLIYISQILTFPQQGSQEEAFSADVKGKIVSEIVPRIESAIQQTKKLKVGAVKLMRRIDMVRAQGMFMVDTVVDRVCTHAATSDQLQRLAIQARVAVQEYVKTCAEGEKGFTIGDLGAIFTSVTKRVLRSEDVVLLGSFVDMVQTVAKDITSVLELLNEQTSVMKAPAIEHPWIKRAEQFKSSLVQNSDVERRIESLNEEIISLARELKLKEKEIQESNVKIEILERRGESIKAQTKQIEQLRTDIAKAKSQEKVFEEAIENLQSELEALERENSRLKKASASGYTSIFDQDPSASSDGVSGTEALLLQRRILALQDALKYVRKENTYLRASARAVPAPSWLHAPLCKSASVEIPRELSAAAKQARQLIKEACLVAASPKLVRLGSKPKDARRADGSAAWTPQAQKPQYEYYLQQSVIRSIHHRAAETREQLHRLVKFPSLARLPSREVTSATATTTTQA